MARQTQPLLVARCNLLFSEITTNGNLEHAREIQQMVGDVRQFATELTDVVFIGGMRGQAKMSLLTWRTWKLKRRAIGSNDAEVQSILEAEDMVVRSRLLWAELHGAGIADPCFYREDLVDVTD